MTTPKGLMTAFDSEYVKRWLAYSNVNILLILFAGLIGIYVNWTSAQILLFVTFIAYILYPIVSNFLPLALFCTVSLTAILSFFHRTGRVDSLTTLLIGLSLLYLIELWRKSKE